MLIDTVVKNYAFPLFLMTLLVTSQLLVKASEETCCPCGGGGNVLGWIRDVAAAIAHAVRMLLHWGDSNPMASALQKAGTASGSPDGCCPCRY